MEKYHLDNRQKGATLIVSLIFLVVLSIIGLAGMDVTSLEEKMAGNMRDRNASFQAAEAAIQEAEALVSTFNNTIAFDGTNGLYELPKDGTKRWNTVDWEDGNEVRFYQGTGFEELNFQTSYIIEFLTQDINSLQQGVPNNGKNFYRITARSVGLSGASEVILQSVYKR